MSSRAERWFNYERALALVTVALLFAIPVMDKVPGPYPPEWFQAKFGETLINAFPGALGIAFGLITLAEVVVPALAVLALLRGEHRGPLSSEARAGFADYALAGASLLLLALTVGSLVARDYDNAFHDFGYLVGVLVLRRFAFPSHETSHAPGGATRARPGPPT